MTLSPTNALLERLARTEARQEAAEVRYQRAERRFRILCGVLLGATTITLLAPLVSPAVAQGYGVTLTSLAARVTALETWQTTARGQVATLDTDLAAVETKTASMSVLTDPNTSKPTVRFSGVNVQIVNGNGTTIRDTNGRGNLIIGYNEPRTGPGAVNSRVGSHNMVIGIGNNYTTSACGGMVVGSDNTISSVCASVSGGSTNVASSSCASVSGGSHNTASAQSSSVSGGNTRTASGTYSWVGGSNSDSNGRGQGATLSGGSEGR